MPPPRSSRGKLYVLGGYGAERSAFVLNGGSWQTLTMPSPRAAAGAAALRGVVYVVGGVGDNGNARTMLAYDTRKSRGGRCRGRRRGSTSPSLRRAGASTRSPAA